MKINVKSLSELKLFDLDNIGYQFKINPDCQPGDKDWSPAKEGWSEEEWEEIRLAKIIVSDKTASTSLRSLENETLSVASFIDWDTLVNGYIICIIRDPNEKYKSAIKEKYVEHFSWDNLKMKRPPSSKVNDHLKDGELDFLYNIGLLGTDNDNPYRSKAKLIPTFVDNNLPEVDFFMNLMILKHEINNNLNWMSWANTIFWYWNNPKWKDYERQDCRTKWNLYTLLLEPNVYFLELEHLSDPKFLKWLQRKDSHWKSINEIPHYYKTKKIFYENYDLFWKEYSEGKILQDKCLVNPLYNLKTNLKSDYIKRLCKILEIENYLLDQIRNDHNRYLSKSLNLI